MAREFLSFSGTPSPAVREKDANGAIPVERWGYSGLFEGVGGRDNGLGRVKVSMLLQAEVVVGWWDEKNNRDVVFDLRPRWIAGVHLGGSAPL